MTRFIGLLKAVYGGFECSPAPRHGVKRKATEAIDSVDGERDEESPVAAWSNDATTALFVSIVQPLPDSGYIGVTEVGRVAQVSKKLKEAMLEDSIWASLCQRESSHQEFHSSFQSMDRPSLVLHAVECKEM
jgi:hypothetical protein